MLTLREVTSEFWEYRLDKPIGGSGVKQIDIIVVHLHGDRDGKSFSGMGFSYVLGGGGRIVHEATTILLDRFVRGQAIEHPIRLWHQISASFNRLGKGPNNIALAAIDVAAWDLYARSLAMPLGLAMGGASSRAVPIYGSGAFYAGQTPDDAAAAATRHVRNGYRAVKPRAAGAPSDRDLLKAVAAVLPGDTQMFVDANEKCDLVAAHSLLRLAADYNVAFVEEPLPANNLAGYRTLAATAPVPIAFGEHSQGTDALAPFMLDRLCAVVQPDLAMMGGLTDCLKLCAWAEQTNTSVSPHFLPALFVHLAHASPAVRWLEDFPTIEPLFETPMTIKDGLVAPVTQPGQPPGHGIVWTSGARETYRVA
ncbi:MAG: enolase C-terminal domain-like protein [Pseudolabrys sp.]